MKRYLLLLLLMVMSSSVVFGQRNTITPWLQISAISWNVPVKISCLSDETYDGPVKSDPFDDHSYLLTANHSNGKLHGAISLKFFYDRPYGYNYNRNYVHETASFTGSFNHGEPNGKFVFTEDAPRRREKKRVEVNFNNGVPTTYKYTSESLKVSGGFSSKGEVNGRWTLTDELNNVNAYQFTNGILISGGEHNYTDAQTKAMATKYANGQISQEELFEQGYRLEQQEFDAANVDKYIFQSSYDYIPWGGLGSCDWSDSKASYQYICKSAIITDNGLSEWLKTIFGKVRDDEVAVVNKTSFFKDEDSDNYYISEPFNAYRYSGFNDKTEIGPRYEYTGERWILDWEVYGYYLTPQQAQRVKDRFAEHNHAVLKRRIQPYFAQNNISFENVNYSVFRYNIAEDKGCGNGYVVLLEGRPANSNKNSGPYSSFIANFSFDDKYEVVLSSIQRVRNIYDDLDDVIAAHDAAIDNVVGYLQQLKNTHVIDSYEDAVEVQLAAFNSKIRDIDINHNDLYATIKSFIDQKDMVNHFHAYMKYYPQAKDLEAQIANKQISVYTTTSSPVIPDWSKSLNLESMKSLVATQQTLLKQYDDYCALKSKSAEIHNQIVAKKLSVLSLYNDMYKSTTSAIVSLEEGIKQYSDLLAAQQSVEQYIALYEQVVANNEELSTKLKPAKCAAKAYKGYYKTVDLNWVAEGAMEHVKELLAKQQALLEISKRSTLAQDEKRIKSLKLTNLDDIIKAY